MTPPDIITRHSDPLARFFAYSRERERIRLARGAGEPGPWTGDAALRQFSFCNIFREDDRVTRWFRTHVRERYADTDLILLATVVFRWFNRVTTGEALFCQEGLEGTPFEVFARTGSAEVLINAILALQPKGPWVTGSYMVPTRQGFGRTKMEGVADLCAELWAAELPFPAESVGAIGWRDVTTILRNSGDVVGLEDLWTWLRGQPFQGGFNAYEIVTDMRHAWFGHDVRDAALWANAGPGAVRGLNRIFGRDLRVVPPAQKTLDEMRQVLFACRATDAYWPKIFRPWEMREVEHTLCEFDKHERLSRGEGTVKRKFVPHV